MTMKTRTPFVPAPRITTVAGYLLTRLAEAGLISVFGVAGDYNLPILDAIADRPDLAWIGMATEQGAGYAADSYARLRGVGALVTTYIVGTPALAAREADVTLHHNLPGRDYGHFARMAAKVTAAQADLRPATAPEEIDRVLSTALRTSRPVYLTIPADVAGIPVLAPAQPLSRAAEDPDPAIVAAFTGRALSSAEPEPEVSSGRLTQRSLWACIQAFLRAAIGARPSAVALRVSTPDELAWALTAAGCHASAGRPVLIEAVLGADDIPPLLRDLTRALAHTG